MKTILIAVIIMALAVNFLGCTADSTVHPLEKVLASGKPTLAEFGGTNCVPCKSMWPILDELAKEYQGKLNVVIVDVAKYQELADKYGVRTIPMQLYFDSKGQVITRHLGAVTKEELYIQLDNIGVRSSRTTTLR